MASRILKILAVLAVTSLVTGCKLAVMVNEGGIVQYSSWLHICGEGTICTIPITDPNFSESFTAIARPGYQFVKWNTGGGFLCANSTSPTCTVELSGGANSEAIVATYTTAYIMPVFEDVGIDTDGDGQYDRQDEDDDNDGLLDEDDVCPLVVGEGTPSGCPTLTYTLIAQGKEWAQLYSSGKMDWDNINNACPEGICGEGAVVTEVTSVSSPPYFIFRSIDMTGWKWASADEVKELFNSYIGSPILGPGVDYYEEASSTWATDFFAYGGGAWAATGYLSKEGRPYRYWTQGWTSTPKVCAIIEYYPEGMDKIVFKHTSEGEAACPRFINALGGWFYR